MHQISHSSEIYGNHKAYLAFEVKTTVSCSRRRRGRRGFKGDLRHRDRERYRERVREEEREAATKLART